MKKLINNFAVVKLSRRQQPFFLDTLAKLLQNGFALEVALKTLELLLPQQKSVLEQVQKRLQAGASLDLALLPTGISATIISQLAIADVHGNLQQCLQENVQTLLVRQKNRHQIGNLLTYPLFLLGSLGTLLLFLRFEMAEQLPRWHWTANQLWILTAIGGCLGLLVIIQSCWWWRATTLQRALQKTHWPFVGPIYQNYFHSVILSGLATFLKSGLSLQEVLQASQGLPQASLQQQLAAEIQQQLLQGQSLTQIVRRQRLLSKEINVALGLGHTQLQLAAEFQTLGQIKHDRLQQQLQNLINLIQPCLFIIVAGVIFGTYLSILLPIYQMMKGL
ncbi:type II secretion system F family protein [Lactobacillus sp. DCY120]|uniref:Type II secretion system F family protein n=1 Tax=Bombilactobacillus apium TaxID=2675299 RepID=A0A850QZ27_9LACO|nr:type II secretion system F family protein [Bombilactobacillus apium]NVY97094.1 type II secretion system F family protein [Bombilactobacillus apium]